MEQKRAKYPSDITKEQFELIRKRLEGSKKQTRPRKYDLYDVFCAVLYLLKEGCSWRALPHDFPKWQNVRYHFLNWTKMHENGVSLLDEILEELVKKNRVQSGRNEKPSLLIIDSKSIQNSDTGGTKGYDAGKKRLE